MKKLALVLALAMLALAACGTAAPAADAPAADAPAAEAPAADAPAEEAPADAPAEGGEKTTLTFMRWGNADLTNQAFEAVMGVNPDLAEQLALDVQIPGTSTEDVANKVRLSLSANETLPDIVQLNYDGMAEFAYAGVLRNLDDVWAEYTGKVPAGVEELAKYDGTYYNFPGAPKTKLWFYRKDIFEQAGIDPTTITDIDSYIAAGQKIREMFPESYIDTTAPDMGYSDIYNIISGNGAKFVDEDGNYILAQDPNFIAAVEAVKKVYDSGIYADYADFTPEWEAALADGTLVAARNFNWFQRYLPGYAPDQAGMWGVAQAPPFAGDIGGSDMGADIYLFFQNAANSDLAVEYVKRLRLDVESSIAAQKAIKLTPILNEALADPRMKEPDPFFGTQLMEQDVIAMETLSVQQCTPASILERAIIVPIISRYRNGEITLDECLAQIDADLNSQIGNGYNPK
jgi:ABC-type glycerol-3-phosphate transport system substrate-binding protein